MPSAITINPSEISHLISEAILVTEKIIKCKANSENCHACTKA